jgi:hypothetical protein
MLELGRRAHVSCGVYFTGGASAVLEGWRAQTVDVDIQLVPDSDAVLKTIPGIKEDLKLNVELASPAQFIPELPGWRERSRFIAREGSLDFFHYDFYAQALSKISRGLDRDLLDVRAMMERGLVEEKQAWMLFLQIEPLLYRFPGIDSAASWRRWRRCSDPHQGAKRRARATNGGHCSPLGRASGASWRAAVVPQSGQVRRVARLEAPNLSVRERRCLLA